MEARTDWWNYASFTKEEKIAFVRAEVMRKKEQFAQRPTGIPDAIRKEFAELACQLSPENLNEDGEISAAKAQMKFIRIQTRWKELEKQLGRKVAEAEAQTWSTE